MKVTGGVFLFVAVALFATGVVMSVQEIGSVTPDTLNNHLAKVANGFRLSDLLISSAFLTGVVGTCLVLVGLIKGKRVAR